MPEATPIISAMISCPRIYAWSILFICAQMASKSVW